MSALRSLPAMPAARASVPRNGSRIERISRPSPTRIRATITTIAATAIWVVIERASLI